MFSHSMHGGYMSGTVHTGMEVRRIDSEMSGLVERPWLQLMCCAACLPCGRNFRWRRKSPSGSEYWMVCRHWTLEIEFNKSLSLLIIRLANYSVTTSLIYKLMSRSLTMDLTFIFHFSFYLILFCFSFLFLFLEQTRVRVHQSRCHISHKLMA